MISTLLAVALSTVAPALASRPAQEDPERAALEQAFVELLTGSRMVGSFTLSGDPDPELHEDSYTIQSVTKLIDGSWQFVAAVEYREQDVPVVLSVEVGFVGDTPMLSVTDLAIPLLGTYSARVLFYDDQYAGVWSGDGYGGQMVGRIERAGEADEGASDGGAEEAQDERSGRADDGTSWPGFRGRAASGVEDEYPAVESWDVASGENVRWRREVPGLAHSSPVIWNDRLFVTTALRAEGEQDLLIGLYGDISPVEDTSEFAFELHAFDKHTGEPLWQRTAWEGVPAIKRHTKGSHAASTPAVDAERVVAFFGTEGLYAWDHDGRELWSRDFGRLDSGYYLVPTAQWGFAASPVLFEDRVYVQCDVQGQSFVAALDARTGETIWRADRDEVPGWSTPTVHVDGGRRQLVCNGYRHIGAYDLDSGEPLWWLEGGGDIPVPTPIVAHGRAYITNAHGRYAPILAIDLGAEGQLSMDPAASAGTVWSDLRLGNYMQTPLAYGEELYFCSDAGVVSTFDAHSGELLSRNRLGAGGSGFTASGIVADSKLYFTSEEGDVHVVTPGFFEVLAVSSLGEPCMATPAVSEGVLYFRTRSHLVAIGE